MKSKEYTSDSKLNESFNLKTSTTNNEITSFTEEIVEQDADEQEFPEGGRGWLVIFGCFCCSMMAFGMINSYGVFQTYYETTMFKEVASSKLSIIGACQASIIEFVSPMCYPLIHAFGIRNVIIIGCSSMIIGFFGLSTIKSHHDFWKCYVFQAGFYGFGAGILFASVMFCPFEWFKKKRAFAASVSMSGVGIGGTIWPIIFKQMINKHGFQWTVMTIAFLFIPLSVCAVLFVPQKLDDKYIYKKETVSNSKFNIKNVKNLPIAFKNLTKSWKLVITEKKYILFCLTNFIGTLGCYPVTFYLDYFATIIAPTSNVTTWLVVIYNIMGSPGRIIPGLVADRVGRLNILILCISILSIILFALWLPSIKLESMSIFIPFVLIFGFFVGPFFSLYPPTIVQVFGPNHVDERLGVFMLSTIPAPILGCLIAGSFIPKDESLSDERVLDSLVNVIIFSGIVFFACTFGLVAVRFWTTRKLVTFI